MFVRFSRVSAVEHNRFCQDFLYFLFYVKGNLPLTVFLRMALDDSEPGLLITNGRVHIDPLYFHNYKCYCLETYTNDA